MLKKTLLLLTLLLSLASPAFAENLAAIGKTPNGTMYVDTNTIKPLRKNNQLFLLVPVEEHYTNKVFLENLQKSSPQLKTANKAFFLYLFTNTGMEYSVPQRLLLNPDNTVALDIGADMELRPVKSRLLATAYETGLQIMERKQRISKMYK